MAAAPRRGNCLALRGGMDGVRARQDFVGLRFTPGSLDKKTDALLAYVCALMAG